MSAMTLKPCPFCGGVAEYHESESSSAKICWVRCAVCGAESVSCSIDLCTCAVDAAAEAWTWSNELEKGESK